MTTVAPMWGAVHVTVKDIHLLLDATAYRNLISGHPTAAALRPTADFGAFCAQVGLRDGASCVHEQARHCGVSRRGRGRQPIRQVARSTAISASLLQRASKDDDINFNINISIRHHGLAWGPICYRIGTTYGNGFHPRVHVLLGLSVEFSNLRIHGGIQNPHSVSKKDRHGGARIAAASDRTSENQCQVHAKAHLRDPWNDLTIEERLVTHFLSVTARVLIRHSGVKCSRTGKSATEM
jgi:hypothetical protein